MTPSARVLIVDDRAVARQTIRSILVDQMCVFEDAADGTTALVLMATHVFDVVFLDLRLPDISGIDVLREARVQNYAVGQVIVLTGLPEAATATAAMQLGAFRYLAKDPISREGIRTAFRDAVELGSMQAPRALRNVGN